MYLIPEIIGAISPAEEEPMRVHCLKIHEKIGSKEAFSTVIHDYYANLQVDQV